MVAASNDPSGEQRTLFTLCGLVRDPVFQKCTEAAMYLEKEYGDEFCMEIFREMPCEFYNRRDRLVNSKRITDANMDVIVLVRNADRFGALRTGSLGDGDNFNGRSGSEYAMSGEAFLEMIREKTRFRILNIPPTQPDSYENMAYKSWKQYLRERGNSYCWMDISIDNVARGRITFELFSRLVPRTCGNFWHLCAGDLGNIVQEGSGEPLTLSYKNSTFFRTLHGAWVMGGDISGGSGRGGYSIYGRYFPNESYAIPHDKAGVLGMCNDGGDSNASSFYITMKAMQWMNGRYVAFGRVVDGMDVVEAIHAVNVKHNQSPLKSITISDCGVIDLTE
ncbi:putative Cyclophilin type peptidyl prolyl cis trans isomerase [Trypanosoma vivax]|uniref:Putative cyclophilin type peptidyl-prolyl cis-trans isomerase n=1 Tax=Trypanosoma vivax (strain Y486) TaxID=1055687 RepID=G0U1Y2_TRYVY|nr:putative Cyclophilin type peptidyl prolyl cis trans isomerase [Trypanosoma vivax]CCC50283.1 putative cyclophilin type peptidyl-prolyl cis-trans isomerase [Trypanosoma vivax Y486]